MDYLGCEPRHSGSKIRALLTTVLHLDFPLEELCDL